MRVSDPETGPSIVYRSARDIASDIRNGHLTASEALEAHIARFEALNTSLNAVVRTDLEYARREARALDLAWEADSIVGPLHGVPMTVKDTFDVLGMPAVAGAPEYAQRSIHCEDATVVKQLKAAGAIIWGKTNTPYLAGDNQTFNSVYGLTKNPYDVTRTPGGSSGGSAVSLAAGMVPLEVGSDIGGSLRIPAHYCGLCALKPSYGLVSQKGHVPPAPGSASPRELNVVGPIARNVSDLRLAFSVMQEQPAPAEISQDTQPGALQGRAVAIWSEERGFPLSEDCAAGVRRAAEAAKSAGARVMRAKPDFDGTRLLDIYLRLLVTVLAEDLPSSTRRFLEIVRPVAQLIKDDKPFSRSKWAVYATSRYRDWLKANELRQELIVSAEKFFTTWDVLITPVSAVTAFPHDLSSGLFSRRMLVDGRSEPYASFLCWVALASACNLPSVVIPAGRAPNGLPVGVQVIGRHGSDAHLLTIAEALEVQLGGFTPPRGYGVASGESMADGDA